MDVHFILPKASYENIVRNYSMQILPLYLYNLQKNYVELKLKLFIRFISKLKPLIIALIFEIYAIN